MRSLRVGLVLWGAALLLGFGTFGATRVEAAPALILLEDSGERNPVYRQLIESLGAVIASNQLGKIYDHIDLLVGPTATRENLFQQIRKRGRKSPVDVVLLTHGLPGRLSITAGDLTVADLAAQAQFANLRWVYMMGCYSAGMLEAWQKAGAQASVGHQDVNSLPGFFFPRLMRLWAEGHSLRDAVQGAYEFSERSASLMQDYLQEKDLLGALGIARSEPVIRGVDLDRRGRTFPGRSLGVVRRHPETQVGAGASSYLHSGFESVGLQLTAGLVPQASLDFAKVPSAQGLLDRVGVPAWEQLKDGFPSSVDGLPSVEGTGAGDEIWIDGQALRYFLSSLREWGGEKYQGLLDGVQGLRLVRTESALRVAAYFDREQTIGIVDEGTAENWKLYAVHVPKTVRFWISLSDGVAYVSGLDEGADALHLLVKMPWLPDPVYLRSASMNLETGNLRVEAGVIGNTLSLIATGQVLDKRFQGVDIWESIARNLKFWEWPELVFQAR